MKPCFTHRSRADIDSPLANTSPTLSSVVHSGVWPYTNYGTDQSGDGPEYKARLKNNSNKMYIGLYR